MKPLTIILPDDLRDLLEEQLPLTGNTRDARLHQLEVLEHLLTPDPQTMPLARRDFLRQLEQSLMEMQTLSGNPAIYFENLPPTKGSAFIHALMNHISTDRDTSDLDVVRDTNNFDIVAKLHHDAFMSVDWCHPNNREIRALVCHDADPDQPIPSIFTTADELIHHMACRRAQVPLESSVEERIQRGTEDAYQQHRADLIAALRDECSQHDVHVEEGSESWRTRKIPYAHTTYPGLFTNPRYNAETAKRGAPEFLLGHVNPYTNTTSWLEAMRPHITPHSQASTKPHTAIVWNDTGVVHDRADGPEVTRLLESMTMEQSVTGPRSPENLATGTPGCSVEHPVIGGKLTDADREQLYNAAMTTGRMQF